MRTLITVVVILAAVAAISAGLVYSGAYNVAADEPHWRTTEQVLALARERSIASRAADLTAPDLTDQKRIAFGAGQYAEMCESCHLAPGIADTEVRKGLNPRPPELARQRSDPRRAFWILKHGIKMTGMPAWGPTHSDDVLWSVTAFLQKLPDLDAAAYRQLVTKGTARESTPDQGEAAAHGHSHGMHSHRH